MNEAKEFLNENIHQVEILLPENMISLYYSTAVDDHCEVIGHRIFTYLEKLYQTRKDDLDEVNRTYLTRILDRYHKTMEERYPNKQ